MVPVLSDPDLVLRLPDPDSTARLGAWFAQALRPGDCVLLEGPIGAGKSHFARSLIQTRIGRAEDVPSPTFTLVQTYLADCEIWHADLYRLSHPDEVLELGLDLAFDTAITLVEWPDRLGDLAPKGALRISFRDHGDGREARIHLGARRDLLGPLAAEWGTHD